MRNIFLTMCFLMGYGLQGCAYYVYSTHTAYGLNRVDSEEYLGPIDTGYDSPITSPVLSFDNGVQVKFMIPGVYNYPRKKTGIDYLDDINIEIFITSRKAGISLDVQNMVLDQYRTGRKTPLRFLEKKHYPSLEKGKEGVLVCRYSELSEEAFSDFYQGERIELPYRETDLSLVKVGMLRVDPDILCGELVAMNINFVGDDGYFTINLPFIDDSGRKEYTVYFYPVGTRYTMK